MKKIIISAVLTTLALGAGSQELTIIHTNDTHSQIDPTAAPEDMGGVYRRKALIDSIRRVTPNQVMLVDAGDAVQGSMYFTLFGGEVEQKLLNAMDYDIQVLGNHEFDNGLKALAGNLRNATPVVLSTNYEVAATPLSGLLKPYLIREVGDNKVGFIAINLNPEGIVDESNYNGLKYLDGLDAANAMAWYLKHIEGADRVVAVTHIGWDDINGLNDRELAQKSKDIDVIIGGHSHTLLNPSPRVANAVGDSVLVVQTGSKGRYLGQVNIDLSKGGKATSRIYPLGRQTQPKRPDPVIASIVDSYRQKVDSVSGIRIGRAATDFPQDSPRLLNLLSDFVASRGAELSGKPVDMAIMNKGGIRNSLRKGYVTKGDIMSMLPFDNKIVVLELKGKDLLDNIAIMCEQRGQGVSTGTDIAYDKTGKPVSATIGGKEISPEATYRIATISYLANGGDYMKPLKHGKRIAESDGIIFEDIIDAMENGSLKGKKLRGDDTRRMHEAK